MNLKFMGGVLIIIGTCIGAGLLALPVSNSPGGFAYSSLIMIFVWAVTALGAFFVLELTQWLPRGANIISIARATLGRKAEVVAWAVYLMLCYSLLCAYISGGTNIFYGLLSYLKLNISKSVATVVFTSLLGYIVFRGVRSLDIINRGLMAVKFSAFFLLIYLIFPHVGLDNLERGNIELALSSLSVAVSSFGFAIVIPSLLDYFEGNVKKVRVIIFLGSLIPLACYLTWNTVIMGALPRTGPDGLMTVLASGEATVGLLKSLRDVLNLLMVTDISEVFASICMFTSFLGVSLALFDFLADGLKFEKKTNRGRIKSWLLTFVPPLTIAIVYPKMFILALSYAGLCVVILSILLPSFMVWNGRYVAGIAKNYRVFGGKAIVLAEIGAGLFILAVGLLEDFRVIEFS
jgi:tyrosine-specific transport protein